MSLPWKITDFGESTASIEKMKIRTRDCSFALPVNELEEQ